MSNLAPRIVQGKICRLRIFSKNVAAVQAMLKGKSFLDALMDAREDPIQNTMPFIWGANQPEPGGQEFTNDDAYALLDAFIDEGYSAEDFCDLIGEIGQASGFFKPAIVEALRTINETIAKNLQENFLKKLNPLDTESPNLSK